MLKLNFEFEVTYRTAKWYPTKKRSHYLELRQMCQLKNLLNSRNKRFCFGLCVCDQTLVETLLFHVLMYSQYPTSELYVECTH